MYISRPLRYDTLPIGRPFYEFELIASDSQSSAVTLIRIMIQNANINPPVLLPLPKLTIFRQQYDKGLPFVQVAAYDLDGSAINYYFVDSRKFWRLFGLNFYVPSTKAECSGSYCGPDLV